jgi:hypothetical protein
VFGRFHGRAASGSSEEGLEQEFNSLAAQCEACEAFIRSQRNEGWVLARIRAMTLHGRLHWSGARRPFRRPTERRRLEQISIKLALSLRGAPCVTTQSPQCPSDAPSHSAGGGSAVVFFAQRSEHCQSAPRYRVSPVKYNHACHASRVR